VLRLVLICGFVGFSLTFILSLVIAGNSWGTSVFRGIVGFLVLFVSGMVVNLLLNTAVKRDGSERGTQIDLTLPPEKPQPDQGFHRSDDTFIPMTFTKLPTNHSDSDDEQARKIAEALRQLKD
jgi:hypothetical protein